MLEKLVQSVLEIVEVVRHQVAPLVEEVQVEAEEVLLEEEVLLAPKVL